MWSKNLDEALDTKKKKTKKLTIVYDVSYQKWTETIY